MESLHDLLDTVTPPPDCVVPYGTDPAQIADLWIPNGPGPHPVVFMVHGGYWRANHDRRHLDPMCADLRKRGYLTCAVEYRRVGQHGGGWPGTFIDVATAVQNLTDQLSSSADRQQRVLVGHSAGGHLALWAASTSHLPPKYPSYGLPPPTVRGVLSLAGLCDLTTAAELGLDNFAAQDLMGGTPKELPTQYQAADPMRLLPTGIRTILLHSAADRSVPIELSQNYAAAARAAGDNAELREVPNAGHFDMISPRSSAWTDVLYAIKDLIQQPDRGPYRYGHGWIG